ncbi:MAG: response regulator [Candidatus Neomarinimicrobiota bacterium]
MDNHKNFSILIIDDEIDILEPLNIYLTSKGYDVTGFTDPRKALEHMAQNTYDMIFTDLKMPHVKGMDIVKAVRDRGVDTKVVIFTGYASIDSSIEALQLGVYDFIRKPFVLRDIERVVEHARDQLRLEREKAALNNYIDQMYSNISMLCDISTILYQVSDFETALDMVLYTMTDTIGVRKAGLLIKDKISGRFAIQKSNGLDSEFEQAFVFTGSDLINQMKIAPDEPTVVPIVADGLKIAGQTVPGSSRFDQCVLIPVQYREHLCGYISIFEMDDPAPLTLEDKLKLLRILSTQVAPIMYASSKGDQESLALRTIDLANMEMINAKMATARAMQSIITFGLLKVSNLRGFGRPESLESYLAGLKTVVQEKLGIGATHIWLTVDTLLLIMPGIDQVTGELTCLKLKKKIEEYSSGFNREDVLEVNHTLVNFPKEGETVSEILLKLWNNFLSDRNREAVWQENNVVT